MLFSRSFFRLASLSAVATLSLLLAGTVSATDYYVDPDGNDEASGLSEQEAWRSLDRVSNAKELKPGDVVRFKSGGIWRGILRPRSGEEGAPILYTSWGEGAKPSFWGSVSVASEDAWIDEGNNLWATKPPKIERIGDASTFFTGSINLHTENGAVAAQQREEKDGVESYSISVEKAGTANNNIQWFRGVFPIKQDRVYSLSFEASATAEFDLPFSLMKSKAPWTNYGSSLTGGCKVGPEKRRFELVFRANQTADDARIAFYFGKAPDGFKMRFENFKTEEVSFDAFEFAPDAGNIILDGQGGKHAAFKRWTREDLKAQDDFWYDRDTGRLWFYSTENPAKRYSFMEAAVMRHVISHATVHDAIFDGLDVRYGAAHGFGGHQASRIVIRNCDVSWIGGGDQFAQGGAGRRVRFGNGIEFWCDAKDNLVENCRIWEVYDAALTNQGSDVNEQRNILYRNNLIWNCEYSFEYWNGGEKSITDNITFVDNICLNAGYGWGHVQRPDKNGRCLMFYGNTAQTTNFTVTGNIFANAVESLVRSDRDWVPEPVNLDGNVYYQDDEKREYVLWKLKAHYTEATFEAFQNDTGMEKNGKLQQIDVQKLIPSDLK